MTRRKRLALCGLVLAVAAAITGAAITGAVLAAPSSSDGNKLGTDNPPSAVDVGFVQDMIVHHQQAVTMSEIVRGGAGVAMASLADVLRGNQLLEIGQLTGFLQIWGAPLVSSLEPMHWMPAHAEGHHGPSHRGVMAGMASQDELNRLGELTGTAKEVHFLQLMMRHHQGGVLMADYAAAHAISPQVKAFARRMAVEQSKENQLMAAFLNQRKS